MSVAPRRWAFSPLQPDGGSERAFILRNCRPCVVFGTARSRRVKLPPNDVMLGTPLVFGRIGHF